MKRTLIVLVALMIVAPAMAITNIALVATGLEVDINYSGDLARAYALKISVDAGTITDCTAAVVGENTASSKGYGIFMGTIVIDPVTGEVTGDGTPVAPDTDPGAAGTGIGTDTIIVEMGSLYVDGNEPPASGTLCTVTVSGGCTLTVELEPIRGGVVLEDATAATTNLPQSVVITTECYAGMADYAVWVAVGSPECWCYTRQCHGDADGKKTGGPVTGYYYVSTIDLQVLAAAWQVKEVPKGLGIATVEYAGIKGACADFDHSRVGSPVTGYYHVSTADLQILAGYWQVKEPTKGPGTPADCLPGNRVPE